MNFRFTLLIILLIFICPFLLKAQSVFTINGVVKESGLASGISGVSVQIVNSSVGTSTDEQGQFSLSYTGLYNVDIILHKDGYIDTIYQIGSTEINNPLPMVFLLKRDTRGNSRVNEAGSIPTITLDDQAQNDGSQEISSLLSATGGPFLEAVSYNFGVFRMRLRGYDSENHSFLLNGVPMNDPETGFLVFGEWGGLNDVLRNSETQFGVSPFSYGFGNIGGNTMINLRASQQRKTTRVSYAISNRTYRNRVMATYNTGKLANGWSFSGSASYRWAQEGYIDGTFYKAYSYFLGIEKEINSKHSLGLSILGSPLERGKSNGAVQEAYDLTVSNYYNSNWGYQNGEVRNSRVGSNNKPIAILRHDWNITPKINLTNVASAQIGYESNTRLDWYNGRDPRPDYYKYLPSAALDENSANILTEAWKNNPNWRQLDWNYMYQVNYNKNETIENADGIPGNTMTGRRSYYILEDGRSDNKIFNWNSILNSIINDRWNIQGGLNYQHYTSNYYKEIDDLLGGDFFLDIDRFAERDLVANPDAAHPNLDIYNHVVTEGERYGYDYDMNVRSAGLWLQNNIILRKWDFFVAGSVGTNTFWREGKYRNGRFPDSSLGESDKNQFTEYGVKGGLTYKINGRNYLKASGLIGSQAPLVTNVFISPRTRNNRIENFQNEAINALEASYVYISPDYKFGLSGFYTTIENKTSRTAFYNDVDGTFVNFNIFGIDQRYSGLEIFGEIKLLTGLKLNAVAVLGQYLYTNRPSVTISNDNNSDVKTLTVYQKNYFIEGTPQQAYNLGLEYNSPHFWWASINGNFARKSFLDMNVYRRTTDIADPELVEPGSENWYKLINQEELPAAFTLDFFGGKSFKIKKYYLNLTVGVNNILNNTDIITGGYEQSRVSYDKFSDAGQEAVDVSKFPPKYFYAFGRNYFISLTFRI